jgi:hypothetical protein
VYQNGTWRHNSSDIDLKHHRHESLKTRIKNICEVAKIRFTLKMEAAWSSETLSRRDNPEDLILKHHCLESHKIHIRNLYEEAKIHFPLKMETVWSPETLVSYQNTAWHHSLEDLDLSLHGRVMLSYQVRSGIASSHALMT